MNLLQSQDIGITRAGDIVVIGAGPRIGLKTTACAP
jgi:hypothetical protein